jgi:hypothetical protein
LGSHIHSGVSGSSYGYTPRSPILHRHFFGLPTSLHRHLWTSVTFINNFHDPRTNAEHTSTEVYPAHISPLILLHGHPRLGFCIHFNFFMDLDQAVSELAYRLPSIPALVAHHSSP